MSPCQRRVASAGGAQCPGTSRGQGRRRVRLSGPGLQAGQLLEAYS